MVATLVPTVKTKYSVSEMIEGFVKGWHEQFNELPSKESVGVLFAQWSLETGQGGSCWNSNFGNVKCNVASADSSVKFCYLSNVWETNKDGEKVYYQPPSIQCAFRAFDSLEDGMAFYLGFIKNGRYASAWTAVELGSPEAFAHLLKVKGYYTAPEADYTKAMSYYFKIYMKDTTFEKVVATLQPAVVQPIEVPVAPSPDQVNVGPSTVVVPEYVPDTESTLNNPILTLSFWQKIASFAFDLYKKFKK
jgi:hypothetical protein